MPEAWVRPSEFLAALASVLRGARRDAGMTLRAVRQATGGYFRPSAINGYERAQRQISLDRFCQLAEVYGTSGDELLRRTLAILGHVPPRTPPVRDRAESLRLFYGRVVQRGDLSMLKELCVPSFIDHGVPARLRLPRDLNGFRVWVELLHRTFSSVSLAIEDVLFVGSQAVVRLEMVLMHPGNAGTGTRARRLEVSVSEWVRFSGDRLSERWGIDGSWLLQQVHPDIALAIHTEGSA